MKFYQKFGALWVAPVLLVLSACEVPPPPNADPNAKPIPKTKEEVLTELRPLLAPYRSILASPGASGITDAQRTATLEAIRVAQQDYGAQEYAQDAMRELGVEIAELALEAKDQERWRLVEALIDVHEVMNLNSYLLTSLDRRAEVILARPKVKVKGFMEDAARKEWSVFMEVTNRDSKKVEKVVATEGDVFHNLKLREIIGNNNAVELEYLRIPGLFFTVEGVSRLSKPPA